MSQASTETGPGAQGGNGGGTGQEPPAGGQQGQEPNGQQAGNGGTGDGGNGSGDQFDFSKIQDPATRSYLEKLDKDAKEARAEAAKYRTERNTLQQQVTETQRQNETAEQTAQREQAERETQAQTDRAERERLEKENRDLRVGVKVQAAAVTAKAFNPDLVVQMLTGKVTLDEQGNPTNLQEQINALKQSDPYLFKKSSTDAGAGQGAGDGSALPDNHPNSMLRRALGKQP